MTAQDARTTAARPDADEPENPVKAGLSEDSTGLPPSVAAGSPENSLPGSPSIAGPVSEPISRPISGPISGPAWLGQCRERLGAFGRKGVDVLGDWGESLAPMVFPPVCVLCGEMTQPIAASPVDGPIGEGSGADPACLMVGVFKRPSVRLRRYQTFCRICETSISYSSPLMKSACERCGWPVPAGAPAGFCGHCDAMQHPHTFDRVCPLYRYQDAVCEAIVAAKFPSNAAVIRELALRLSAAIAERWSGVDFSGFSGRIAPPLVTSVPTSWRRQIQRGGSGTQLLACRTAKYLGIAYRPLLTMTRSIQKQAWLDDDARGDNVRSAFAVRRSWRRRIAGRHVILVDDVMTTGSTANEVARVMLEGGVSSVSVAVVALAIRDR